MNAYREALFEAFVWPQAVEEQIRSMILDGIENGHLPSLQPDEVEKSTFGPLIQKLKSFLSDELYQRLNCLKDARNEVVHRASYVTNIFVWAANPNLQEEAKQEIKRLEAITVCAGDLYGDLLGLQITSCALDTSLRARRSPDS